MSSAAPRNTTGSQARPPPPGPPASAPQAAYRAAACPPHGQQRHSVERRQHDDPGIVSVQRGALHQHQQHKIPSAAGLQHAHGQQHTSHPQHRQHGVTARLHADINHHRRGRHQPGSRHRRKAVAPAAGHPMGDQRRQPNAAHIGRDQDHEVKVSRQSHAIQQHEQGAEQRRIGLQPPCIALPIGHRKSREKRRRGLLEAQLAIEHRAMRNVAPASIASSTAKATVFRARSVTHAA